MSSTKLGEIAKILRSKNAGPFKLTLDVFFHQRQDYDAVQATGIVTKDLIAQLYQLDDLDTIDVFAFDKAAAIKITFPRAIPSGNVGDSDVYGAQQHGPLYNVMIPWPAA